MMNMKKLLALLLAVVMVVGMFPVSAAAEGEETTCATCGSTEHIEHPAENPAPVDNCDNCDDETCTGCNGGADPLADGGEETPEPRQSTVLCAQCNATEKNEDGTVKHNEGCETLKPAVLCDKCGATETNEDGTVKHNEGCETLKPAVLCEKCNATEKNEDGTVKHNEGCETMKPAVLCEKCNATEKNEDGTVKHNEGCETLKPAVLCEKCNATEKNEDGTVKHSETCETLCTCTPIDGVHQGECIFAPVVEKTGPQVGDKIWIKSGSKVYKNMDDNRGHTLILNYHVTIESIEYNEEGAATWYQFSPAVNWFGKYEYVKVENTSVEEPEETDSDSSDTVTTEDGKSIQVDGIPENAELQVVDPSESDMESIAAYIREQTKSVRAVTPLFAYDISIIDANGDEWQPGDKPVEVKLTIPDLALGDDEPIQILHLDEGRVEVIQTTILDDGKTVSFEASGFSPYVGFTGTGVLVTGEYFYNMATATSVNLSTILTAIGVTYEAKNATSVTPQIDDVETNLITATQNANKDNWAIARPSALMEEDVKLCVVFNDGKSIDITITDQGYKYYLTGTKWDFGDGTETVNITPYQTSDTVSLKVNKAPLRESDMENHKTTYVKPKEGATVPGAYNTIHLLIYMRAGEALKVNTGTYFPYGSWVADDYDADKYHKDGWEWVYTENDGTGTAANYIVADDVSEVTVADIQFRDSAKDAEKEWIVNAKLIIVPEIEREPMLVRNTLTADDQYDVVKLPITLYNYDGAAFNKHYADQNVNFLGFANYSKGVQANAKTLPWSTPANMPNSGNVSIGIMASDLVDGLPVVNSKNNTDFFSTTEFSGKDVMEDVGFEFIYNKNTGYYTYSSNLNHAQYNEANNTIELYNETLSPAFDVNILNTTYSSLQNARAGFYPFGNIQDAFMNAQDPTEGVSYKSWREAISDPYFQQNALYAQDPVRTASVEPDSSMDMHFGLQLRTDFYMPTESQVDVNGDGTMEDLIYSFTGDDDLWVYVDGKLALDIGGAHTAISGIINFTQKTVTLESYAMVASDGKDGWTVGETGTNKEWSFEELGLVVAEDSMHTLQIFYLERWSGESNCRMHFNLPLVPSDAVNVSKKLVNQDNQNLSVTPVVDYTFTLFTADDGDDIIDATNFTKKVNAAYTVTGNGAPIGIQYTDANGQFRIRDGWVASFAGIPRFTEVYVVESTPNDGYTYVGSTVTVNKAAADNYTYDQKTATKVMKKGESVNFDFVNKMQTQPLTVEKQVVNGTAGLIKSDQKFDFDIVFTKDCLEASSVATTGNVTSIAVSDKETENDDTVHLGGTFQLGHNESVTIPRVPVNMTYTLKEVNPDSTYNSFDAPAFESTTCTTTDTPNAFDTAYTWTMVDGAENKVKVTNQQRFDLTISKQGILPVDHDDEETQTVEEHQSTIYTVVGKNGEDEQLVEMEVAICGNDSVTIKKLPVGAYTVVENTDWAWRYDPVDGATKPVGTIPANAQASVIYKNTRTEELWLSGDCHARNWWGGNSDIIEATGLVTPTRIKKGA